MPYTPFLTGKNLEKILVRKAGGLSAKEREQLKGYFSVIFNLADKVQEYCSTQYAGGNEAHCKIEKIGFDFFVNKLQKETLESLFTQQSNNASGKVISNGDFPKYIRKEWSKPLFTDTDKDKIIRVLQNAADKHFQEHC